MSPAQLSKQLDTITLTLPITLEDMRELHALVKSWRPRGVVDVYHANGKRAFVTVDLDGTRIRKAYDGV